MSSKIGGNSDSITRRELFGAASLAAAGLTVWGAADATSAAAQRAPGKHEPLENFKYDIEASEGWVGEAGSAKEANVSEFPCVKEHGGSIDASETRRAARAALARRGSRMGVRD